MFLGRILFSFVPQSQQLPCLSIGSFKGFLSSCSTCSKISKNWKALGSYPTQTTLNRNVSEAAPSSPAVFIPAAFMCAIAALLLKFLLIFTMEKPDEIQSVNISLPRTRHLKTREVSEWVILPLLEWQYHVIKRFLAGRFLWRQYCKDLIQNTVSFGVVDNCQ